MLGGREDSGGAVLLEPALRYPINYVGHAEQWDELAVEGSIAGKDCLVRFKREGRTLAVASIFRDLESLEAEVSLEREQARYGHRSGSEPRPALAAGFGGRDSSYLVSTATAGD